MFALSRLALVLALSAASSVAHARDITGSFTYRERIALPEDAQLVVELRGPEGIVAEARIETAGNQVPLPFTLVAPDNGAYVVQGAIFVGGRADFLSDPAAVTAGEQPADLGTIKMMRRSTLGFSSRMDCGGTIVRVGFPDGSVILSAGEEAVTLAPVEVASGAKFGDGGSPETWFWSKGNTALVRLRGVDLPECAPVIEQALLPMTARGNEPFWRLDLTEDAFVYEGNLGATRREGALPAPVAVAAGARFDVAADFGFTVGRSICRDTMTGMPHPLTVSLTDGGQTLQGCGGAPADLLAGGWTVVQIEGAVLPEEAEVTIAFDPAEGRVFGKGGCNRYNGAYSLTGEGLSFGPAASTMMACPQDLMSVEAAFLKGLETVSRFDLAPDGQLQLIAGDAVVARARR